jgi:hypothetical protein
MKENEPFLFRFSRASGARQGWVCINRAVFAGELPAFVAQPN